MQRFTPVPSSSPARCVSRGWISIRQQKCSAPLGAVRTHRFSGGLAPSRARRRRSASCSSAAPVGPSSSKRARARRGREHEVERHARGVGRHQHGLVVDRDDPLAPADLLLHEVGEQVAAHRAHGVGAEALALAGDRGGHEVQRVQLRVGVRERGAGLAALVDDQVPAGGVGVRAHALAPGLDGERDLLGGQVREVRDRLGRVDDHLVRAGRGLGGEEVGVGVALGRAAPRRSSAGYRFGNDAHAATGVAVAR